MFFNGPDRECALLKNYKCEHKFVVPIYILRKRELVQFLNQLLNTTSYYVNISHNKGV